MGNALSQSLSTPPVPEQNPDAMMGGNALSGPPMGAGGAPGAPQGAGGHPPPPPSDQETVKLLRHFSMVEKELSGLLSDPDIGKMDMKSKIIDGTTKLVAQGILTPAQAVTELGKVPDGKVSGGPFQQKKWLEQQFAETLQAQNSILNAHRAAGPDAPPAAAGVPPNA